MTGCALAQAPIRGFPAAPAEHQQVVWATSGVPSVPCRWLSLSYEELAHEIGGQRSWLVDNCSIPSRQAAPAGSARHELQHDAATSTPLWCMLRQTCSAQLARPCGINCASCIPGICNAALAGVALMLLLMAGDVEANPGPPSKQPAPKRLTPAAKAAQREAMRRKQANSRVTPAPSRTSPSLPAQHMLGVTDEAAKAILAVFADFAGSWTPPSNPHECEHQWKSPTMRGLAAAVEARLGEVRNTTHGLTAPEVSHLPDCPTFQEHRAQYYPAVPPMDQVHVKRSDPDGICLFNSCLLACFGSELEGRHALRLRCLLEFVQHSSAYWAALGPDRNPNKWDFGPSYFKDMATPGGYQTGRSCAVAATVLQCPVLLLCPGLGTSHWQTRARLESMYAPPLYMKIPKLPLR